MSKLTDQERDAIKQVEAAKDAFFRLNQTPTATRESFEVAREEYEAQLRLNWPTVHRALARLTDFEGAERALAVAFQHGGHDGEHHARWVIDQMVRALTGDGYDEWVRTRKDGEDGPDTYAWDEGGAP